METHKGWELSSYKNINLGLFNVGSYSKTLHFDLSDDMMLLRAEGRATVAASKMERWTVSFYWNRKNIIFRVELSPPGFIHEKYLHCTIPGIYLCLALFTEHKLVPALNARHTASRRTKRFHKKFVNFRSWKTKNSTKFWEILVHKGVNFQRIIYRVGYKFVGGAVLMDKELDLFWP